MAVLKAIKTRYVKQLARYLAYRWCFGAWLFVMVTLIRGVSFQRSLEAVCTKQVSEDPGAAEKPFHLGEAFSDFSRWLGGWRKGGWGGEVHGCVCLAGLTWGQGFME